VLTQVKPAGVTVDIEATDEVLLKFKDELTLVLTPTRAARRVFVRDVKAQLCCQPSGINYTSFQLVVVCYNYAIRQYSLQSGPYVCMSANSSLKHLYQ